MASWQQNYQIYKKYLENILVVYQNRQDIKIFTELLLSLASITIFAIFAIKPTLVTISSLYAEMKAKEEVVKTLDTKIENLEQARSLYESQKARIEILNQAIPSSPLPEIFVRQVEGISQRSETQLDGLVINSVSLLGENQIISSTNSPTPEETLQSSENLSVSVTTSGDYPHLAAFLLGLESMRRPISESSSTIVLTEGEEKAEIFLTIDGKVPFLR